MVRSVTFNCLWCGESVTRPLANAGMAKFCSRKHAAQHAGEQRKQRPHHGRATVTCNGCGEPMERWRHEVGRSKLNFHNWDCRRAYFDANSRNPAKLRDQVWERDGGVCVDCGGTRFLEVHHVDGTRRHALDNLALVCKRCHVRRHIELRGGILPNGHRAKARSTIAGTRFQIRKCGYSSRPWRIIDTAAGSQRPPYSRGVHAEGFEVWLPEVFDHPQLGPTVIPGPVAFDRRRDAVAWMAANEAALVN